jgi:hypothetical protein
MRRIDTPKIGGGMKSRGLGLVIDTPKTLLDLRSRSGEIVLHTIRGPGMFCSSRTTEEEISEEELYRYTRYRWLYDTDYSRMVK